MPLFRLNGRARFPPATADIGPRGTELRTDQSVLDWNPNSRSPRSASTPESRSVKLNTATSSAT